MAHPATDLHFPPSWSKTFTSFVAQVVLSGTGATSAPVPIEHMPCQVLVVYAPADVFAYTDNAGVVNTITFPATATGGALLLRAAINTIETTTTVDSVTVFWQAPIAHV